MCEIQLLLVKNENAKASTILVSTIRRHTQTWIYVNGFIQGVRHNSNLENKLDREKNMKHMVPKKSNKSLDNSFQVTQLRIRLENLWGNIQDTIHSTLYLNTYRMGAQKNTIDILWTKPKFCRQIHHIIKYRREIK